MTGTTIGSFPASSLPVTLFISRPARAGLSSVSLTVRSTPQASCRLHQAVPKESHIFSYQATLFPRVPRAGLLRCPVFVWRAAPTAVSRSWTEMWLKQSPLSFQQTKHLSFRPVYIGAFLVVSDNIRTKVDMHTLIAQEQVKVVGGGWIHGVLNTRISSR